MVKLLKESEQMITLDYDTYDKIFTAYPFNGG